MTLPRYFYCMLTAITLFGCGDSQPAKPLVFYVLGDWGRRGEPNQLVLAYQMNEWTKKQNPKFIVTVGDNFYNDGVTSVDDTHWKESFEDVYNGNNLIRKPWYVSLGNHDYRGNTQAQIEYHKKNSRWNLEAPYYSKVETLSDGGRVRFIMIDTTPFGKEYYLDPFIKELVLRDTVKQKKWLDSLTALNDVDWKVVVGHHHMYTGGARNAEPSPIRAGIEPIFVKNKVDVYFCGHEHDLQHLKATGKPTNYFLSGGGSDVRPTGMGRESIFSASEQGFMSVSVLKSSLEVNIVNFKGQLIYKTVLTK